MSKYWTCKIGPVGKRSLPAGSDKPMREAVERAFKEITGRDASFTFSGWDGSLTAEEQEVADHTPA